MTKIFISYRREDSAGEARTLYKDLVANLGKDSVFMDVDSIGLGRDFRQVLDECLESCEVLLALIGKDWLDITGPSGRRLDDPGDFVRQEISSALKRGIPVAPVLLQGATMPPTEQLPEELHELAYRNGFELRHARWESDVQEMISRLNLTPQSNRIASSATNAEHSPTKTPTASHGSTGDGGVKSKKGYWLALIGVMAILATGFVYYQSTHTPSEATEQASTYQESLTSLIGTYRLQPMMNDWHEGQIQADGNKLKWTNKAGVSWGLTPDFQNNTLRTDSNNPYYEDGAREFKILFHGDQISGFTFGDGVYQRVSGY